ncbi:hypothetical protein ElyMa_005919000 [Elysia marginata]|uniref:Uncharacterized protein n=1 Tax=Elysia marginata TaxID=1093978 RepID=A0AAV4G6K7_9GAST|nr:hypothetical protein ElyMa_005919000 [Elysia marginata]
MLGTFPYEALKSSVEKSTTDTSNLCVTSGTSLYIITNNNVWSTLCSPNLKEDHRRLTCPTRVLALDGKST